MDGHRAAAVLSYSELPGELDLVPSPGLRRRHLELVELRVAA